MHYSVEKIVSLLHKQKMRRVKKEKWKISNGDFHLVNFAVWILYYEMETRIRLKHFHFCRIFKQRFIARGRGAKRPKADEPTDARTQRAVTPPRWQRRCVKASVTGVSNDKNRVTRESKNEAVPQESQQKKAVSQNDTAPLKHPKSSSAPHRTPRRRSTASPRCHRHSVPAKCQQKTQEVPLSAPAAPGQGRPPIRRVHASQPAMSGQSHFSPNWRLLLILRPICWLIALSFFLTCSL